MLLSTDAIFSVVATQAGPETSSWVTTNTASTKRKKATTIHPGCSCNDSSGIAGVGDMLLLWITAGRCRSSVVHLFVLTDLAMVHLPRVA